MTGLVCPPVAACPARPRSRAISSSTCRRNRKCTNRWCARKPIRASLISIVATTLYYIEVEEPDMHKPSSDMERVFTALKEQWQVENISADLTVLGDLQKALRKGEWKITCAVYARAPGGGNRLAAVWPGFHDKLFGLAVDVGSTTVAMHLTNLSTGEVAASAGLMNPQIRFGEDLMSRVSYVMMNPGWRQGNDQCHPRGAPAAGGSGCYAGGHRRHRYSGSRAGRQSGHASSVLGHRPDRTGRCAVCTCRRPVADFPGARDGLQAQPRCVGFTVLPCIAGHVGADAAAVVSVGSAA